MFRVVTVDREYGAGGGMIAQRVAEILGWSLLDRMLVRAVARAAGVDADTVRRYDEHVDPWWRRFHRGGLRAAAVQAGVIVADGEVFDTEAVAALTHEVIVKAATTGNCVIVGRGAQCILQDRADVLHAFIYGPLRERISRIRSRLTTPADPEELIESTDRERAGYIRTYYGCGWKDPHLYHTMISSQIGVENAACLIVEGVLRGCAAPYAA